MNKVCTNCKQPMSATAEFFYKQKPGKYGLQSRCKKCQNQIVKQHRQTERGKEVHNKNNKKYRERHPEKVLHSKKSYYCILRGYLQRVYANLRRRCNNPKHKQYKDYGGRNIQNKFTSLDDFRDYVMIGLGITDISKIKSLTIDRIDNEGHYEPGNIRWVTRKVNNNNKRSKR